LFDDEILVDFDDEKWGPYYPVSGPIPLHRYRAFKRGKAAERSDRIRALASQLNLPVSALSGHDIQLLTSEVENLPELQHQPFDITELEYHFPTFIAAKLAIAEDLAMPLAKLSDEERMFIEDILAETLIRTEVLARVRNYFRNRQSGEDHAG
jgi:hypothetical protein